MYTVTRQIQYPGGDRVVEVSQGGFDYVNPGALCSRYDGDGEEFTSPLDAAKAAIFIRNLWQSDCPDEEIFVAYGYTGGMTMPFSPCEPEELLEWAEKRDAELPRCDQCGDVIIQSWRLADYDDFVFCQEYCAEEFEREDQISQADLLAQEEELAEEEVQDG